MGLGESCPTMGERGHNEACTHTQRYFCLKAKILLMLESTDVFPHIIECLHNFNITKKEHKIFEINKVFMQFIYNESCDIKSD